MNWKKQMNLTTFISGLIVLQLTTEECRNMLSTMLCDTTDRILIDPSAVGKVFLKLHTKRSNGPDSISARSPLFQLYVDTLTISSIWKKAAIIPVPKNLVHRTIMIKALEL